MSNVVFAIAFMGASLIAALSLATQTGKPKHVIYTTGLAAMLAQVVLLFAVLHVLHSPLNGEPDAFASRDAAPLGLEPVASYSGRTPALPGSR